MFVPSAPAGEPAAPLDAVVAAARVGAEGWRLGGALGPHHEQATWDVYFGRRLHEPARALRLAGAPLLAPRRRATTHLLVPGERACADRAGGSDVTAPAEPGGVYTVTFHDVPGTSRSWAERGVTVDAFSGEVLDVRDATTRRTAGDAFLDWQWPLHSGKAFVSPGRIAVFVGGLACPLLFVTGVVRWWRKRSRQGHAVRVKVTGTVTETAGKRSVDATKIEKA